MQPVRFWTKRCTAAIDQRLPLRVGAMGDTNQLLFIQRHAESLDGPYLEVGSKDYGSTQDLRAVFAGRGPYVGVDFEQGPGVDRLLDLTADFEHIDTTLGGTKFGTIFCLSVLEHCRQPFRMAENLTRLLKPGGKICISAPFSFKFHAYPSDYWRFTHEGIKTLFPRLEFAAEQGAYATSRDGEFGPLDEELGRITFGTKAHWRKGHVVRGLSAKALALLARIGILRWLSGYRYVLAPTQILMIGTLKHE